MWPPRLTRVPTYPLLPRSRRVHFACLAVSVSAALPAAASAQSNYRLAPVGGRSTLLGGTGIVYGRDAAAAFLNPATAVLADDNRLSFSANFYTVNLNLAPNWYQPGRVNEAAFGKLNTTGNATTDFEFNALPSSLCLFIKAGSIEAIRKRIKDPQTRDAAIGLCFATVQSSLFNFAAEGFNSQQGRLVTRQAQTVSQSYVRFAFGPTYAMHITEALAVGASLHASLASHRSLFAATGATYGAQSAVDANGKPISTLFYSGSRGDALQVEPLLGATYRFGRQKIGVSFKLPSLHVFGVGGANQNSHYEGSGIGSATSTVTASGTFKSRSPMRISLGTGVEAKWGNAEFNTSYSPATSGYSADLEGNATDIRGDTIDDRVVKYSLAERSRGVVNFALGAEVFFSSKISVLGGLATDLSAVSKGALNGSLFNYHPSRLNRASISVGAASHGDGGEILLGTEISAGYGDRLAVNSYQLPSAITATGTSSYQMMFVIAGSTSLKAIKRAVVDVKKVLSEPKKTEPIKPANPESKTVVPAAPAKPVEPVATPPNPDAPPAKPE